MWRGGPRACGEEVPERVAWSAGSRGVVFKVRTNSAASQQHGRGTALEASSMLAAGSFTAPRDRWPPTSGPEAPHLNGSIDGHHRGCPQVEVARPSVATCMNRLIKLCRVLVQNVGGRGPPPVVPRGKISGRPWGPGLSAGEKGAGEGRCALNPTAAVSIASLKLERQKWIEKLKSKAGCVETLTYLLQISKQLKLECENPKKKKESKCKNRNRRQ